MDNTLERPEFSPRDVLELMLQVICPSVTVHVTHAGDLMASDAGGMMLGLFRSVGIAEWRIQAADKAWEQHPNLPMAVRRFAQLTRLQEIAGIPRMALRNERNNPHGYTVEACYTGDPGIYDELRISIFDREDDCVGDVLVGLSADGEPHVLVTADNDGDDDHPVTVYPCRAIDDAVIIMGSGI